MIHSDGRPGPNYGDPVAIYAQYQKRKGDARSEDAIREEGRRQLAEVRGRGLFVAEGHGRQKWDLQPSLKDDIHRIYDDAKLSLWAEFEPQFVNGIANGVLISTKSANRSDYILHPTTGEELTKASIATVQKLRQKHAEQFDTQIVVSDGLNALAIMEDNHLEPFLTRLRAELKQQGRRVATENLVVTSGRVRAGYRIGETLFGGLNGPRSIIHIIGERPGTGHRTFSVYITAANGDVWAAGTVRPQHYESRFRNCSHCVESR